MSIDKISVSFNWRGRDVQADLYWNGKVGRLRVLLDGNLAICEDWMDWSEEMRSEDGVERMATAALAWEASTSRAKSLYELYQILQSPIAPAVDWGSLPTYGGVAPSDAREVWSWNEDSVIVGRGRDLQIMTRARWASLDEE